MGPIKDIRHLMLMEERRVHGVERQHLMVRLLMGKMDGTNKDPT